MQDAPPNLKLPSLVAGSLGTNEATVGGGNSNSVLARRRVLRQFEEAADPDSGRPQTAQGFMHPGHTNTLAGHSTTAERNKQEDFNSKVRRTQSFSSIPIHYQVKFTNHLLYNFHGKIISVQISSFRLDVSFIVIHIKNCNSVLCFLLESCR